jgi:glutamine synthetase
MVRGENLVAFLHCDLSVDGLPEAHLMNSDPSELAERGLERLGVRHLPASLEEVLGALESDRVVRSWFSEDLLDCYMDVKRTEIFLLEGASPEEACERYLNAY